MLHLEPATEVLAQLVQGVREDQLTTPTPCSETSLGALLDHVDGLAQAFTAGARKTTPPGVSQGPNGMFALDEVSCTAGTLLSPADATSGPGPNS
jgi:hypothetical protein